MSVLRLKTFIVLVAEIKMGILFTEHHADILQFQENNLQSPIDKPHWSDNICFFIIWGVHQWVSPLAKYELDKKEENNTGYVNKYKTYLIDIYDNF